jgi:hypothetical protein
MLVWDISIDRDRERTGKGGSADTSERFETQQPRLSELGLGHPASAQRERVLFAGTGQYYFVTLTTMTLPLKDVGSDGDDDGVDGGQGVMGGAQSNTMR